MIYSPQRADVKDKITPQAIEKYLALLEDTPRRIAACTAGVDEARLSQAPGPKAWSVVKPQAWRTCAARTTCGRIRCTRC
jgi:hypothetical protein